MEMKRGITQEIVGSSATDRVLLRPTEAKTPAERNCDGLISSLS
jgi:hypothetical protein